jgi:hypothetical protein
MQVANSTPPPMLPNPLKSRQTIDAVPEAIASDRINQSVMKLSSAGTEYDCTVKNLGYSAVNNSSSFPLE